MKEKEEKIINIINKLRPFLMSDGGDIEFIKLENNIVYIKLLGACLGCQMVNITLKEVIETTIKNEIPEISEVINLE
ncbi:MAG: NifU family protein [Bacilli bacterium]|nr:NifU family protein [Bacilli bacterium]MDD4282217.1 NifU family protein [Bacilli bacterium]MDD4718216.1 NifU family protein [Bacilli bacterium]